MKRGGGRRLALVATMALAGWTGVSARGQIVKAPRYSGGLDAPAPQLNLPPLPPAITPHGEVVEDVVARVNDQIISRSDVARAEQQLSNDAQQNHMSAGDLALAQRDMLRDMIDEQLLLSKAKELGLNADAEVVRRLDEIRKENKLASLDDLAKAAQEQNVNFEDFKAQIRNQILKQQVVQEQVGRKLQLSDSDVQKYYQAHLDQFQQPEQIRLSEIMVPLPENATPEQIAQAEAKANQIKTQVMQNGDFAELAKKYSGGPSAQQGGELGLWKRGALAKVLEDQTFDLKPGESTQPIRTRQGFVILKVTEHDPAGPAPLKDVQPQIEQAIYMQAMQPALRAYLTKLREDSYVELAQGFTDSGATANENRTLYTAYAPPSVKKKKPKQASRFERSPGATGGRLQTVAATKTASPDTTGTRTITGPEARSPAVDPNTGLAVLTPVTGRNGKIKKVKREKIRYGQAPRTAIPAGTEDVAVGIDTGKPTNTVAAPGAVMSSAGTEAALTANGAGANGVDDNPLAPRPAEKKKGRFAATEPQVKAKKASEVSLKTQEKIKATPTAAPVEEKETANVQATPLGLNGDQLKKKPKPKRKKGEQKQRIQEQAPTPKAVENVIAPTANSKLAPTDVRESTAPAVTAPPTPPNSSVPKSQPNEPDTTLPPVTQPPPGSPQQGQPVPGTQPPA